MGTSILRTVLFVAAAASTAIAVEPGGSVDAWVVVGARHSNQMSGNMHDLERARKLAGDGPALFVRQGGHEWMIRDAKLLGKMQALLAPIEELGKQQGALGEKQGALGQQQGELGRKMGALGRDAERNAKQMEELGRQMDALGKQMDVFGAKMDALGAKMDAATHELDAKIAALVDEARAANLAQPIK